jgi:hypothetical protein
MHMAARIISACPQFAIATGMLAAIRASPISNAQSPDTLRHRFHSRDRAIAGFTLFA